MAAKEMYDYLSVVAPDNDVTLSTPLPQDVLTEKGLINQEIHLGDDGSEERVGFSTAVIFYVTLVWKALEAADSGTILDFYFDAAKGNGRIESFKWSHPTDGHTYVVRFNCDLARLWKAGGKIHEISSVSFKVLGRIAD